MIDLVDIKDISGNIRFSTPINEGSKRKYQLMKEDCITLKFSVPSPVYFHLGDRIDNELGIFELVDMYKPTYNENTGGYDYELRLDAYYWKWKNKKFKFTPEHGGQEASWNLTAPLDEQLGVFIRNLNAIGYKYRGLAFDFTIDNTVENASKVMSYSNVNLIDALSQMAEAWECEWWMEDNYIRFGRCEHSDPVDFKLGDNVESMTRSDSQSSFATRVYAFGSTRNISTNYRPIDESTVINGIVQKRLMLPVETPYIDAYPNMVTEEAVEDIVVFEDVYPRRVGTIRDVTTHEYTDEIKKDGQPTKYEKWNAYRFKDSGITFSEKYVLPTVDLKLVFQSGALNGMEFKVWFNPDKLAEKNTDDSWNPLAQVFEIVRNQDYGQAIPNDSFKPKDGDTYVLFGFDTKFVSDTMIPDAEIELKEKAEKYIEKSKIDPSTYTCKMMSDYMVNSKGEPKLFEIGDCVKLINDAFFETGSRESRIIGFEYNLDILYDSPVYTVGEKASYSRISDLESKIESLTYKGQTYTGGSGPGVYVIGVNDKTLPSDRNTFSAKRALTEFVNKVKDDTVAGHLTLEKGATTDLLQSSQFTPGTLGAGYLIEYDPITGKSYIEVDEMYVRLKAVFDSLVIKESQHVGGQQIYSCASIECTKVEHVYREALFDSDHKRLRDSEGKYLFALLPNPVYRCYFTSTDGSKTILNQFVPGDLAQCRQFDIKDGTTGHAKNRYYWRHVVSVGDNYIDLAVNDCEEGSDIPEAGDKIIQLGNRTDVSRQNAIIMSAYGENAPSKQMLQGINSYSLVDRAVLEEGFDRVTNQAYTKTFGRNYVGAKDKSSYMEYTQDHGLELRGAIRGVSDDGKSVYELMPDGTSFFGVTDPVTKKKTGIIQGVDCMVTGEKRTGIFSVVDDDVVFELDPITKRYLFKGRVEADEGIFKGKVEISDGKIRLDEDGSGQLASGAIKWDKDGGTNYSGNLKGVSGSFKSLELNDGTITMRINDAGFYLKGNGPTFEIRSTGMSYEIPYGAKPLRFNFGSSGLGSVDGNLLFILKGIPSKNDLTNYSDVYQNFVYEENGYLKIANINRK